MKLIEKVIQNPIYYQKKILKKNIQYSKKTLFGEKYNFRNITKYNQFAQEVPIHDYIQLKPYIDRAKKQEKDILWPGKTKWFAKSSGTTQTQSKFIPITKESLEMCHFKAGKDMLSLYLNNNPKSQILNGKSLMVGGSTNISKFNSYYSGDLSAIIIQNLPMWVQLKRLPSRKTALLENWEKKIEKIIQETIHKNITSISGVPSWTIIIINSLMKKMNLKCLTEIWPNLELYMHGGISFENHKQSFKDCIHTKNINYLELYNASEGFFGIQNDFKKSDLLLLINHGVFYEFIPIQDGGKINNNIIPLERVELNKIYTMIISTNGGLWRYEIGDTITFTSLKPYKIKIIGRIKSFINAFGEELNEDNANQAINLACYKTNAIMNEYIAGPLFYENKTGCHEWFIEFKKPPSDIKKFNTFLDEELKILNSDYSAKRSHNILLKTPIIHVLKKSFFYNLLKQKQKIGGQHKIQRLHNNRKLINELMKKL